MRSGVLTDQEMAFAREIVGGASMRQAGIAAGYASKQSGPVSKMAARPRVQAEIARLRKLADRAAVASCVEAQEMLTGIMRNESPKLAMEAVDRLSRLLGWDAPAKVEVGGTGIITQILAVVSGTSRGVTAARLPRTGIVDPDVLPPGPESAVPHVTGIPMPGSAATVADPAAREDVEIDQTADGGGI
jgi:hypothetical protein